MLAEMPESVFLDWQEFFSVHPFGEDIRDGRTARLMSMIAASVGAKGAQLKPSTHMLPAYGGGEPKRTPEEVDRDLRRAFGIPDA